MITLKELLIIKSSLAKGLMSRNEAINEIMSYGVPFERAFELTR